MAAACLTLGAFSASAQGKMGVSAGAELALPMGDFSDNSGFGFGGSAMFHYNLIKERLDLTGSVGYLLFSGKKLSAEDPGFISVDVKTPAVTVIPIRIGADYRIFKNLGLYAGLDLGVSVFSIASTSVTIDVPLIGRTTIDVEGSTTGLFSLAPRIGYKLPVGNNELDLSLRYDLMLGFKEEGTDDNGNPTETTSNLGFVGFRAAYRFNFGD